MRRAADLVHGWSVPLRLLFHRSRFRDRPWPCSAAQQLESLRQRLKEGDGAQVPAAAAGGGMRQSVSSSSLAGEGGAEGAGLVQRVAALKAARDKLIAALDQQVKLMDLPTRQGTAV